MQETQYNEEDMDGNPKLKKLREFFEGDEGGEKMMGERFAELQKQNHTLVRRVKIGRNDQCPCNSGKKFKKCCIHKIKVNTK